MNDYNCDVCGRSASVHLTNIRDGNYTRRHGRMPASVEELREGMALPHDSGAAQIADSEVRAQLEYVDGLIDFCQSHGRMPQTPDEMPPAPPGAAG